MILTHAKEFRLIIDPDDGTFRVTQMSTNPHGRSILAELVFDNFTEAVETINRWAFSGGPIRGET